MHKQTKGDILPRYHLFWVSISVTWNRREKLLGTKASLSFLRLGSHLLSAAVSEPSSSRWTVLSEGAAEILLFLNAFAYFNPCYAIRELLSSGFSNFCCNSQPDRQRSRKKIAVSGVDWYTVNGEYWLQYDDRG